MVVAGSKVGMGEVDHCGEGQGVGEQGGVGRDRPVGGQVGMGEAPSSLCTSVKITLFI